MAKKKFNLDETWKLCLSMWRWIAKQRKSKCSKSVWGLKAEWIKANGFSSGEIHNDCFFCHYYIGHKHKDKDDLLCPGCPAWIVDRTFDCYSSIYNHNLYPIAFYNKLVSLNRKRKKKLKPK